jgi:hypothetical protein
MTVIDWILKNKIKICMKLDRRSVTCNHVEISVFVHHGGINFIGILK